MTAYRFDVADRVGTPGSRLEACNLGPAWVGFYFARLSVASSNKGGV